MGKPGRPFVDDPRNKEPRVRMNNEEFERLNRVAKAMGMSKSDTIRKLIEDQEKRIKEVK